MSDGKLIKYVIISEIVRWQMIKPIEHLVAVMKNGRKIDQSLRTENAK